MSLQFGSEVLLAAAAVFSVAVIAFFTLGTLIVAIYAYGTAQLEFLTSRILRMFRKLESAR